MVDFGDNRPERPLLELASTHMRPGDIYTHCFSGLRGEQNPVTGDPSEALLVMRQRGIYCDIGHGGGSFAWTVALPLVKSGYLPNSISTDLHITSMNGGMKDLLNVADKLMAVGETLQQVIAQMTSHPAHEIKQDQLGNLSVGAPADVAVLSLQTGNFGFTDMYTLDTKGNVFVADTSDNAGEGIELAEPLSLSFASTPIGSTSSDSPRTVIPDPDQQRERC